jgi:hypothetical protein
MKANKGGRSTQTAENDSGLESKSRDITGMAAHRAAIMLSRWRAKSPPSMLSTGTG